MPIDEWIDRSAPPPTLRCCPVTVKRHGAQNASARSFIRHGPDKPSYDEHHISQDLCPRMR
jgi:hypothetical protein